MINKYGLLETLSSKLAPVFDRIAHVSAVDVVKCLRVGPVGLYIVDLEVHVWWRPIVIVRESSLLPIRCTHQEGLHRLDGAL